MATSCLWLCACALHSQPKRKWPSHSVPGNWSIRVPLEMLSINSLFCSVFLVLLIATQQRYFLQCCGLGMAKLVIHVFISCHVCNTLLMKSATDCILPSWLSRGHIMATRHEYYPRNTVPVGFFIGVLPSQGQLMLYMWLTRPKKRKQGAIAKPLLKL